MSTEENSLASDDAGSNRTSTEENSFASNHAGSNQMPTEGNSPPSDDAGDVQMSTKENQIATKKCSRSCLCSVLHSLSIAIIAVFSWIILSLIDGEFFSCALTSLPYSF